jgi:hypothetical protein
MSPVILSKQFLPAVPYLGNLENILADKHWPIKVAFRALNQAFHPASIAFHPTTRALIQGFAYGLSGG